VTFLCITSFVTFIQARNLFHKQPEDKSLIELLKKKGGGKGNRTFGVGVNYMFPAPGLSVKYGFTERIKVQASAMFRSYGVAGYNYRWTMFGAELHYCFNESDLRKGSVLPFVFAGGGRGGIKYDEAFGFADNTLSWWSYNVGGGLEWFPAFLNNNLGFSWKLGYGSIGAGSGFGDVSIRGVFMYGFGIHYFIK
jgi:hypothetical protein